VALAKERKIRRRERLEQYNEEYRLQEQQGLSPPPALANSSLDDEEESDGERTTSCRWEPAPPSPQAEGTAVESTPEAGMEPPAAGLSVEVLVGTAQALAGAVEAPPALEEEETGFSSLR
jgi:hypothetical protein